MYRNSKLILLALVFATCMNRGVFGQSKISLGDNNLGAVLEWNIIDYDSVQLRIWNKSNSSISLVSPNLLDVFYQAYQNPTDSIIHLNIAFQSGIDAAEYKDLDSLEVICIAPNQALELGIFLSGVGYALSLPSNRVIRISIAYQMLDYPRIQKVIQHSDFLSQSEELNVMIQEHTTMPHKGFFPKSAYLGFAKRSICRWTLTR